MSTKLSSSCSVLLSRTLTSSMSFCLTSSCSLLYAICLKYNRGIWIHPTLPPHLTLPHTPTVSTFKILATSFTAKLKSHLLHKTFLTPCNIVIYKKYINIIIQMIKIYFSCIFGLCLRFLAQSSPTPWNFLSDKSNRDIIIFGLLPSVLAILQSLKGEIWNPLSTAIEFMLIKWLLESTWRWGLVNQENQSGIDVWNF